MNISHAKAVFVFALLLSWVSIAHGQTSQKASIIDAASIAYADFNGKLLKEKESFEKRHSCDMLCNIVYNIDSYNIGISTEGEHFTVVLLVRKHKDMRIIGGGGEYRIRKSDLEIVKFTGYE